jgi:chaperonin GroES
LGLLDSITDSVDTSLNQLIDAGTAQIAGGGFIGGVRLQGSGQGGSIFFRPGEYQTVRTRGPKPPRGHLGAHRSAALAVTMQMLEMLLAAAKDIASIKDVITGESPSTAPVGTTLALQNQALQVFSSIYKRIYRGFRDEFRLMYQCLKRWGTDRERKQYTELTGGDFDQDFSGDGTDIQPVADPTVVSKMQKIAKMQTVLQLAESPVGMAAGMTQPGPAQALILDALDVLDVDRPERFVGRCQPNPELIAARPRPQDAEAGRPRPQGRPGQKIGVAAKVAPRQARHTEAKTTHEHAETLHALADAPCNTTPSARHRRPDPADRLATTAGA